MLELRERGRCYPNAVEGVNVGLAFVDGLIAFFAFYKLIRIHSRNSQLGWTRQKGIPKHWRNIDYEGCLPFFFFLVFHLLIGSSNLGDFLYFVLTLVAACKGWICWSHSCGFIVMAFPRILFVAAFLLLFSFWVDLCHQPNDDEEDEGYSPREPLLEKMNKSNSNANSHRRCCTFRSMRIGSRQKTVILVIVLVFATMVASSVLIWTGMGMSHIHSALIAEVYVDLIAVMVLMLGGALACYGLLLFLKMRKVRSEQVSSEMWKVTGLAIVCLISFTLSATVAIATHIPLFYRWDEQQMDGIRSPLILLLYYFIGSSVPSAFVLFVMRELPPPVMSSRQESTTIAFISDRSVAAHSQRWIAATSAQNQVSRASPI